MCGRWLTGVAVRDPWLGTAPLPAGPAASLRACDSLLTHLHALPLAGVLHAAALHKPLNLRLGHLQRQQRGSNLPSFHLTACTSNKAVLSPSDAATHLLHRQSALGALKTLVRWRCAVVLARGAHALCTQLLEFLNAAQPGPHLGWARLGGADRRQLPTSQQNRQMTSENHSKMMLGRRLQRVERSGSQARSPAADPRTWGQRAS